MRINRENLTDELIIELCKDENVNEIMIDNGVVSEESYIKIPISEIKNNPNDEQLGRLVRQISENY